MVLWIPLIFMTMGYCVQGTDAIVHVYVLHLLLYMTHIMTHFQVILLRYKFDQEEFDSGSTIWPCCKAFWCSPCSAAQMGVHYEQVKFRDYIDQARTGILSNYES